MYSIRPANSSDCAQIDELYKNARRFMAAHGNPTQWTNGFPNAQLLQSAMAAGLAFVCCDQEQENKGSYKIMVGQAIL